MRFQNRRIAGTKLAEKLIGYKGQNILVLGLPRGGVPVAYEVAKALDAPLDIYMVRKLSVPGQPELAMGALGSGSVRVLNQGLVNMLNISERVIERVVAEEQRELERREQEYRGDRERTVVKDKIVILIDDGMATGASMKAAIRALRQQEPQKIVVAVPTAPPETCDEFDEYADEVLCLTTPDPFLGVGGVYDDFSQTSEETVKELLEKARQRDGQDL